jgi:radical SAM-linked protein
MIRARIYFEKTEAMRFTGHLDLQRAWERSLRRARLPLAYSQGFHPQPRLNLAAALPLGFTSQAEILDAWFDQEINTMDIELSLKPTLPPGIRLRAIETIELKEPALQTQVCSACYRITLLDPISDLDQRIEDFLNATTLPRVRNNKAYDLRPLVEKLLRAEDHNQHQCLDAQLAAREGATGRPEELLDALGLDPFTARVHRYHLILSLPQNRTGDTQ